MFTYHETHPFQYIAIVSLVYGVISTTFVNCGNRFNGWRRTAIIVGILLATVFISSIPGGILWKIHDMQAGYFTTGNRFWNDILWGALNGLKVGWLVILLSFPYNIIATIIGYLLTHFGFKIFISEK